MKIFLILIISLHLFGKSEITGSYEKDKVMFYTLNCSYKLGEGETLLDAKEYLLKESRIMVLNTLQDSVFTQVKQKITNSDVATNSSTSIIREATGVAQLDGDISWNDNRDILFLKTKVLVFKNKIKNYVNDLNNADNIELNSNKSAIQKELEMQEREAEDKKIESRFIKNTKKQVRMNELNAILKKDIKITYKFGKKTNYWGEKIIVMRIKFSEEANKKLRELYPESRVWKGLGLGFRIASLGAIDLTYKLLESTEKEKEENRDQCINTHLRDMNFDVPPHENCSTKDDSRMKNSHLYVVLKGSSKEYYYIPLENYSDVTIFYSKNTNTGYNLNSNELQIVDFVEYNYSSNDYRHTKSIHPDWDDSELFGNIR